MAKPMLVTLPARAAAARLLAARAAARSAGPRAGRAGAASLLAEKLPLLALSAASSVVTLAAQRAGGRGPLPSPLISPALRVANALVSYAAYLGKTVWPADLAVYYPYPDRRPPLGNVAGRRAADRRCLGAAFLGRRTRPCARRRLALVSR